MRESVYRKIELSVKYNYGIHKKRHVTSTSQETIATNMVIRSGCALAVTVKVLLATTLVSNQL